MKLITLAFAASLALTILTAKADMVAIGLQPSDKNPASPQMGDVLTFRTVILNNAKVPLNGLIAWISLVQVDKGKEQPVDLEDWSANKAIVTPFLGPGETVETNWPVRLIRAGHYRVVVSAVTGTGTKLTASPFADFSVRQKPVIESQRVLPVALGIPLLLGAVILWRRRRYSR